MLIANSDALAALDDSQQVALRDAYEASIVGSLDAAREDDEVYVDEICGSGLVVRQASDDDLTALHSALAPLYDELREDERTAGWLARIAELKSALDVPPDTATMTCEPGAGSDIAGPLPDGTYRNVLTTEDVSRGCQPGSPGAENLLEWGTVDHVQELVIKGSQVTQTSYPVDHPEEQEPGWSGSYRTFRDTIELLESGVTEPLAATWTFDGIDLVIGDMRTDACDHPTVWTSHPWKLVEAEESDAIEGDYTMTTTWKALGQHDCPPSAPEGTADAVIYELGLHDGQIKMYARIGGPDAPREDAFFGPYELFRDRVELGSDPTLSAAFSVRTAS